MNEPIIVAIDGPAASGKSTTAKAVGQELSLLYIDTGAMYRAATLALIEANITSASPEKHVKCIETVEIDQKTERGNTLTYLNGKDVSSRIRDRDITNYINLVSTNPDIRSLMVQQQQFMGRQGDVILDGRDIGTVVFPNAQFKFFMVATVEERAKRRLLEFQSKGDHITLAQVISDLKARDLQDEMRSTGPLKQADDAIRIDTSTMSIKNQVMFIVKHIKDTLAKETK
jgi:cytidylate kinase